MINDPGHTYYNTGTFCAFLMTRKLVASLAAVAVLSCFPGLRHCSSALSPERIIHRSAAHKPCRLTFRKLSSKLGLSSKPPPQAGNEPDTATIATASAVALLSIASSMGVFWSEVAV